MGADRQGRNPTPGGRPIGQVWVDGRPACRAYIVGTGQGRGSCQELRVVVLARREGKMSLRFEPLNEPNARAILAWRYEAPYSLYNPASGDLEADLGFFTDLKNAYYAVTDPAGVLVAYCCFGEDAQVPGGDYGAFALDIGLGVRPDLTGRGRGLMYVQAVLDFAGRTFAPTAFRVTIAAFNGRAQRVWEQAGFRPVQSFHRNGDGMGFVVLLRGP